MIADDVSDVFVLLDVPAKLQEDVVDWLLSRGNGAGFASYPAFGHSTSQDHLSAREQVAGRQRREHFLVQIPAASLEGFIADAGSALGEARIRYVVLPVIACGHLGATGPQSQPRDR